MEKGGKKMKLGGRNVRFHTSIEASILGFKQNNKFFLVQLSCRVI